MSEAFRFPSRIYGIADDGGRTAAEVVDLSEGLLAGGARLLQLRAKQLATNELVELARGLRTRCARAGATFLVNDRIDVARLVDADGVHLGQDDLTPHDARAQLGPNKIVGLSTHNLVQARAAMADTVVSYIGFGPVFPTSTKEKPDPVVVLDGLRAVRVAVGKPIVAIGGIGLDDVAAVLAAGADAVAMIGAVAGTGDPAATIEGLVRRFD